MNPPKHELLRRLGVEVSGAERHNQDNQRRRVEAHKRLIANLYGRCGCSVCGAPIDWDSYVAGGRVLDLHHNSSEPKEFSVGRHVAYRFDRLLPELRKCVPVHPGVCHHMASAMRDIKMPLPYSSVAEAAMSGQAMEVKP